MSCSVDEKMLSNWEKKFKDDLKEAIKAARIAAQNLLQFRIDIDSKDVMKCKMFKQNCTCDECMDMAMRNVHLVMERDKHEKHIAELMKELDSIRCSRESLKLLELREARSSLKSSAPLENGEQQSTS